MSRIASIDSPTEVLVGQVADEFFAALTRGEQPSISEFAERYPDIAEHIRRAFPALLLAGNCLTDGELDGLPPCGDGAKTLGDFRLIRELGRGGMGTVFEAEQISMGRRVALKVLPFAALAHDKSLQRFHNEVRAAAALDHPHIVSVYSVGEERGVHFYAMQLIRGQTLADVIQALRREHKPPSAGPLPTNEDISGDAAPTIDSTVSPPPTTKHDAEARISTVVDSRRASEHFRMAARLGIQAAEALQHAHDLGVLHRDIKPSNLMLDGDGKLYVTDFGLARIEADAGLTMTGDIIGTLRYIAPEQALAKRVVIDHRADVYSLGATLYELLTLQPAFGESDRSVLLKQIAFEEPRPLRKIDRRIPAELETIVLKAMAKMPDERYQTAQQLADDLRAFLEHRPIKAKPPTLVNRAAKWSRRHVGIVWTALAALLVVLAVSLTATVLVSKWYGEANVQRGVAEREFKGAEAARLQSDKDRREALSQRGIALQLRDLAELNEYNAEIVSGQTDLQQGILGRLDQKLIRHLPLGDEPDRRGWEWYYLFSFCHPEQRTLHCPGYVLFAAWSPDGEYIATAGTIWKAKSGECVRLFSPSLCASEAVAWSPDSRQFAWGVTAEDSAIYIWDRRTDNVRALRGHASSVWCLGFSPDGKQLASGSMDHTIKIWDLASGAVLRTLDVGAYVTDVDWTPDGELLAVGVSLPIGGLQIWSVTTGERVAVRKEPDGHRVRVSWRPDGRQLAVSSPAHWYILDRPDWKVVLEHSHPTIRASNSVGADIKWNPSGTQLALANGTAVTVWDPAADNSVTKLAGHIEPVNSVDWSPDGRQLVTTDAFDEIRIWDVQLPLQPPAIATGAPLERLSWELDSNTLVSVAASDMTSTLWRVTDAARIKDVPTANIDRDDKEVGVLSPDRRLTAHWTRSDEKRPAITVRDSQTGAVHSVWHSEESFEPLRYAWSPDGSKLAIAIGSPTELRLEIWDANQEQRISRWIHRKFDPGDSQLDFLTWSPDGARVAVVAWGDLGDNGNLQWSSHVHVIDVASGNRILKRPLANRGRYGGQICALAWSPDTHMLALGSSEGLIDVVDVDLGQGAMSCKAHDVPIHSLDWSPDGQRLATAAADGVIKVIESRDGNELLSLRTAQHGASHIAWSPDGQRLAAATEDGTIQVWDARRGYEFAEGGSRRSELAWAYFRQANANAGEAANGALRRSLELAPQTLDYRSLRGNALACLGQYDEAAKEFAAAVPPQTKLGLDFAIHRAYALLGARDMDAFRELGAAIDDAVRNSKVLEVRLAATWPGALVPGAVEGFNESLNLINKSPVYGKLHLDKDVGEDDDNTVYLGAGAMLYRLGRYEEALRPLTDLTARLGGGMNLTNKYELACDQYFLAMTRHQLGHEFQARRCLGEALATDQALQNDPSLSWTERVALNTLHREAKGMIEP